VYVPHGTTTTGPAEVPYHDDTNIIPPANAPEGQESSLYWTYQLLGWNRAQNATEAMNLSEFNIISDTNFYSVWNKDPVSVYDNVHPEWFTVTNSYTYGSETGYEIQLAKEVQGKLTIPAFINNVPVLALRSSNTGLNDIDLYDNCLKNVTHVFIQRASANSTAVNLRVVRDSTFASKYGSIEKLKYFDFAANGL